MIRVSVTKFIRGVAMVSIEEAQQTILKRINLLETEKVSVFINGRRDMKDFVSIYHEFQPRIQRYLSQISGEAEASDLTQAVFLKISRSLGSYRGESSLATWIFRIATNVALDRARSPLERESPADSACAAETAKVDFWSGEPPPAVESQLIRREMNACIREVVERLPHDFRTVLVLSEFEELKDSEIAEVLGVSLQTVKIRLHRARTKLRETLESRCTFYRGERNELACDRKIEDIKG